MSTQRQSTQPAKPKPDERRYIVQVCRPITHQHENDTGAMESTHEITNHEILCENIIEAVIEALADTLTIPAGGKDAIQLSPSGLIIHVKEATPPK